MTTVRGNSINMNSKVSKQNQFTRPSSTHVDGNIHLLSDYFKKCCYFCITKNCKKTEPHGESFPIQFSNYVKYPTNIEYIKKSIIDTGLNNDFDGKKPYYVICRNFHQECSNCNNLRLRFIDNNNIALCYGIPFQDSPSITVGVHIDLKLTINNSLFKIEHVPIKIDIEKLMENYQKKDTFIPIKKDEDITNISNNILFDSNDIEIIENNNEILNLPNQENVTKLTSYTSVDSLLIDIEVEKIVEKNVLLELNEQPENGSPFNFEADFPSLTPTNQLSILKIPSESPINFNKLRENILKKTLSKKDLNDYDYDNNIDIDDINTNVDRTNLSKLSVDKELLSGANAKDNTSRIFSVEITNSLLDKENARLKRDNIKLEDKLKLSDKELKDCQSSFESYKLKINGLIKSFESYETKDYFNKWVQNMYTLNNAVLDTINSTYYKDVEFVEQMYSPSTLTYHE